MNFKSLAYPQIAAFAVVGGALYFYIMESSIPKASNCSFASGAMTDILAFIAGAIIAQRGKLHNDKILFLLGLGIIVEHVLQMFAHKLPRSLRKK